MSISAYRRRQEMAEKPRELERRAFSIVTGKLAGAKDKGGPQLIDACYLNYQLWSTLQGDLALPDNALPVELKARLLSLSIWVQRYTHDVMRGAASADPPRSSRRAPSPSRPRTAWRPRRARTE